jgi:hypothetical protein
MPNLCPEADLIAAVIVIIIAIAIAVVALEDGINRL